jgi:hypothetical protein
MVSNVEMSLLMSMVVVREERQASKSSRILPTEYDVRDERGDA